MLKHLNVRGKPADAGALLPWRYGGRKDLMKHTVFAGEGECTALAQQFEKQSETHLKLRRSGTYMAQPQVCCPSGHMKKLERYRED